MIVASGVADDLMNDAARRALTLRGHGRAVDTWVARI